MTDNEREIHSLQALSDFWQNNSEKTTTKNGRVYFVSSVEYHVKGKPPEEFQSVTIWIETSGYDPHISFLDTVSTTDYHAKFTPQFQVMSLEENVLTIRGSSPKMGENYVVKVFCTEATHPKE